LPSWIQNPDLEKPYHGRDHISREQPLCDESKDKWVEGLPEVLRQYALGDHHVGDAVLKELLKQYETQDPNIMAGTRRS
jgi:hypothetical protein